MARALPKSKVSPKAGCCFGVAFALFALPFLGFFLWQAYKDFRCFTEYRQATCTIVNKRIVVNSDSDGNTHRPEFEFEFAVPDEDRVVKAKGYDNWNVSSSGRSGKQAILDRYEVGKTYPCWYDPQNPTRAVLVRRVSWMYLFALIPLVFIVVGVSIAWHSRRGIGRGASPEERALRQRAKAGKDKEEQSVRTTPGEVLAVALSSDKANEPGIGCLIFSVLLLGGGIVVYMQWTKSLWGLGLAMGVLGLIGAVLTLMTLAGQRRLSKVQLEANTAEPIPGQALECWLRVRGETALNSVTVKLVCEERATYQQGTDTRVAKETVFEEILAEQSQIQVNPLEPFEMRGRAELPLSAMHTFKSKRNEIAWFLQVDCDIPRWPDSSFKYPLIVAARWTGPEGDAS